MASAPGTATAPAPNPALDTRPQSALNPKGGGRGGNHWRGGRGGNRGPQHYDGARGNRKGAREPRGSRGDRNGNQHPRRRSDPTNKPAPPQPPPPGLSGGGSFGTSLTEDAETTEGKAEEKKQEEVIEDVEAELCFICASNVVHNSIAPCNHRTCHICALRMRALYKTRACAHCRTEANFVIFTDNAAKRYEDFVDTEFQETDEVLGIKYEQKEIYADTVLLLRYNCPDQSCDIACWGWPDLHRHVKGVHHKVLCDLCARNKKIFAHEHELFTVPELRKHEKFGDDNPGAVDQSGFKGHPECGFCRQRFYGDDELYAHCRDKHERCHICDRRSQGRQQQYYVDYTSLEDHFRSGHFLCADQECMEKKFVVFESEMDLKAHQLEAHPNGLSKDARRDARRVDISAFDYRQPHQDNRAGRRGREGRERGRGRNPNTEPLPQSTAQPIRRDELAYQRQLAIQSAQSVTTRSFSGQITSMDAYPARPAGRNQDVVTAPRAHTAINSSMPSNDHLNVDSATFTPASPTPQTGMTPQEHARHNHHLSVINRASLLLKNDTTKITTFRTLVSSYNNSTLTAPKFLDVIISLFSISSADVGKLIKELADIYEDDTKRNNLLKAWNNWRAINEDYPSLPGPSGVLPGSSAASTGSGGHRVLKLKSSTAQSSRSAVSKQGSWGNSGPANPVPPVPASSSANRAGTGRVGATPWVAPSATQAISRPSSRPPTSIGYVPARAAESFPALPVAAKPNTAMMGLTRGTVRWDDRMNSGAANNPWGGISGASSGGSGTNTPPQATDAGNGTDVEVEEMKKKGNKGKKQTLYKFG